MNISIKLSIIFLFILFLLGLSAMYPSPAMIGVMVTFSSVVIVYQTILILKDEA